MADWVAIYERAEDNHLKMLDRMLERRKAVQQEAGKASSQDMTGTTTMSQEGSGQGSFRAPNKARE